MAKLLHIQASPRGDRSASIAVANQFLKSYRAAHPGDTVETLDLWAANLPEYDGPTLDARYAVMNGQPHTPGQLKAWKSVTEIIGHFKSADKVVLSLPMWNFSIPYKLKQYIDILVQPGLTFLVTPAEGTKGLVTGRPLLVVYARGWAYGPGSGIEAYDQQSAYVKQIFGFIGFTGIRELFVEPTLADPASREKTVALAAGKAAELGRSFLNDAVAA